MIKAEISTIDEEFEKSRVKAHIRTRRGKLERVREFSRKGAPKFEYGDFVTLKPGAEPNLSYSDKQVPKKWLTDGGLWAVDGYEQGEKGESGILNINRVESPYPGAFCSFVGEDEVAFAYRPKSRRRNQRIRGLVKGQKGRFQKEFGSKESKRKG